MIVAVSPTALDYDTVTSRQVGLQKESLDLLEKNLQTEIRRREPFVLS